MCVVQLPLPAAALAPSFKLPGGHWYSWEETKLEVDIQEISKPVWYSVSFILKYILGYSDLFLAQLRSGFLQRRFHLSTLRMVTDPKNGDFFCLAA